MIKNIFKGFWYKFTNKHSKLAKQRLEICKECKDRDGKWCGICGCLLDAKTRVSTEHCSKNLW